jgi:putative oxidoreductase
MAFALFTLHVVVGLYFVGHGAQKLFGVLGGHGLEGTAGFFDNLGLRPGRLHATAAGFNEFAGGLLLTFGLLTPLGALLIIATMVAAIWTAHLPKGPWATNGGYELNLIYIAAAVALAGAGPGAWSLDNVLGLDLAGTEYAVGALVLGLIGGAGAVLQGRAGSSPAASSASSTA